MKVMKNKKNGYSIVELSVVIIIVSIILSLIISWKYSFQQTKVLKTVVEIKEIKNATDTFITNYGYLPGDALNTISLGISNINTDGNGNKLIEAKYYSIEDTMDLNKEKLNNESIYFWLHLYNTNLLKRNELGAVYKTIFLNKNLYYSVFSYEKDNYLHLGSVKINDLLKYSPFSLTPLEAFVIDKKIDDSLSNNGKIQTVNGTQTIDFFNKEIKNYDCADKMEYNVKNKNRTCQLIISLD